jgi:hypothetical protein
MPLSSGHTLSTRSANCKGTLWNWNAGRKATYSADVTNFNAVNQPSDLTVVVNPFTQPEVIHGKGECLSAAVCAYIAPEFQVKSYLMGFRRSLAYFELS